MNTTLQELETAFQAAGFDALVSSIGIPTPVPQLLVYMGDDDQGRDYYLQVLFLRDLQQAMPVAQPLTEADGDLDYLQIYTALPVEISAAAFPDLARLILMVNKTLRVGAFGLHESDNRGVYLRQMLLCPGGRPDLQVVIKSAEMMLEYLDAYGEVLEKVGTGATTLADVLAADQSI